MEKYLLSLKAYFSNLNGNFYNFYYKTAIINLIMPKKVKQKPKPKNKTSKKIFAGGDFLGNKTNYKFDKPDSKTLQAVENPHRDLDYSIKLTCPEFTSLCPITSQPDFAHIIIDYIPQDKIIESKSLKLYLFSYRNYGAFHEKCTIQIAKDLIDCIKPKWLRISGFWYPRGGIPIDIFFENGKIPSNIYIKENNSYQYIPRQ